MIERIFRNPKTTILGLILLVFGGVLVWFEKATLTEYSAFIIGGFALIMTTDGENNKDAGGKGLEGIKKAIGKAYKAPKQEEQNETL